MNPKWTVLPQHLTSRWTNRRLIRLTIFHEAIHSHLFIISCQKPSPTQWIHYPVQQSTLQNHSNITCTSQTWHPTW